MMGQSSNAPSAQALAVISPRFCAHHPVELTVTEKTFSGDYAVTDVNGNIVFKVETKFWSFGNKRIMLDGARNPIVTLQPIKLLSVHMRWRVYRGDSTESKDILFSVRRASFFQFKTRLDVFLASNTSEHTCDFHIKKRYSKKSCTIYHGNSDVIVAQMKKFGKDSLRVTVSPNVDYAFIISLIVILDQITKVRNTPMSTSTGPIGGPATSGAPSAPPSAMGIPMG